MCSLLSPSGDLNPGNPCRSRGVCLHFGLTLGLRFRRLTVFLNVLCVFSSGHSLGLLVILFSSRFKLLGVNGPSGYQAVVGYFDQLECYLRYPYAYSLYRQIVNGG
jgi:hypothetical protein